MLVSILFDISVTFLNRLKLLIPNMNNFRLPTIIDREEEQEVIAEEDAAAAAAAAPLRVYNTEDETS